MYRFCRPFGVFSQVLSFGLTLGLQFLLAGCEAGSLTIDHSAGESNQLNVSNEPLNPAVSEQASGFTANTLPSDALPAPDALMLSIHAETEALVFQWTPDQQSDRVKLFQFDREIGEETLLGIYSADDGNTLQLPSKTPLRHWNDELFRIELCTDNLCLSSERTGIAGLTTRTSHVLHPAVFIENESFADSFTLTADASVLIIALPVSGTIDIYLRNDHQWVRTQRYRLPQAELSTTRQLLLNSSANGDTIAIGSIDKQVSADAQITILERLGETWLTSTTLKISNTDIQSLRPADQSPLHLQISDNGNLLLLTIGQTLSFYRRDTLAWSIASTFSVPEARELLTVVANGKLDNVVLLERESDDLWLSQWAPSAETWQQTTRHSITGIKPTKDIGLALNVDASKLMINGWEAVESSQRTPVIWRFNVSDSELQVVDSLRSPPAWDESAQLRFAANGDLDTVAVGWNNMQTNDALIHTYLYKPATRRWRKALQLPANIPSLAKQAFAQKLLISADGNTLLIANPKTTASANLNKVGELLIFR